MRLILILTTLLAFQSAASSEFDELKALADKGDADAQFYLGNVYLNGEGLQENVVEAVKWYRKAAIYLSLRARKKKGAVVQKYGAIGLMIFVMIPLPFTGAYIGTIAAYIFKINYKKALLAINIGVLIALTFIILVWPLISSLF